MKTLKKQKTRPRPAKTKWELIKRVESGEIFEFKDEHRHERLVSYFNDLQLLDLHTNKVRSGRGHMQNTVFTCCVFRKWVEYTMIAEESFYGKEVK